MNHTDKSPNYVLCMISGAVTAVSFKIPNCNFLIWFSLIPCFYVLFDSNITKLKQSFLAMFSYGITFYSILYYFIWSIHPMDWTGLTKNQSFFLILLAWILISILEAIFTAVLGAIWFELSDIFKLKWLVLALLWIIMEWLQGLGSLGLTWGRLANSQYNNKYIIQSVSLFGTLFLSGIIVLANSLVATYLHNKSKYIYAISFFIVFGLNFGYGYFKLNNIESSDKQITASIIQANINTEQKWEDDSVYKIFSIYEQLTEIADNNSDNPRDLIVWAETALPIVLNKNDEFLEKCFKLSKSLKSTILVGGFEDIDNKSYNTIFKFSPMDKSINVYQKQKLVPFGEYIPFRSVFAKIMPIVENIISNIDDLSVGKTIDIMKIQDFSIGNLICFDSTFPNIARKQVLDGANILCVETNDSWFNGSTAIEQHLAQSVIRAVENNRYILRSANTGISAVISPSGEVLSALYPEIVGYINYDVPILHSNTLYTELGDIIVFISVFLIIIIGFFSILFEYILAPFIKKMKFFLNVFKH